MVVCTWNLEGRTELKLHEITCYMIGNSVDILCIQEARKTKTDQYTTEKTAVSGQALALSCTSLALEKAAVSGQVLALSWHQASGDTLWDFAQPRIRCVIWR